RAPVACGIRYGPGLLKGWGSSKIALPGRNLKAGWWRSVYAVAGNGIVRYYFTASRDAGCVENHRPQIAARRCPGNHVGSRSLASRWLSRCLGYVLDDGIGAWSWMSIRSAPYLRARGRAAKCSGLFTRIVLQTSSELEAKIQRCRITKLDRDVLVHTWRIGVGRYHNPALTLVYGRRPDVALNAGLPRVISGRAGITYRRTVSMGVKANTSYCASE